MTQNRYKLRLWLLVLAILAGLVLEHEQHQRLAEAEQPIVEARAS